MRRVIHSLLLAVLLAAPFAPVAAQEPPADDIRKLDDEVQDAKTDALDIAAELNLLEQRLLYPSATRLTITFALGSNANVRPGALEIRVDGDIIAQHVYGARELEALQKGGVQTVYTGNITAGKHALDVRIIGELGNGTDFERAARHTFTKGIDATRLAVTIDDTGRASSGIRIDER